MNWLSNLKLIPTIAESLVDKGLSYLESEVTRHRSIEETLMRLRRTAGRINSLLIDTEERSYLRDESIQDWLRDLKSISFDTDDLLDECQTALNVYSRNSSEGSRRKRKWHQISPSMGPEWGPLQRRRFALEIEKIDNRLAELAESRKILRLRGMDQTKRMLLRLPPPKLGSAHEPTIIVGRQFEKDHIVNLLISDQKLEGNLGTKLIPVVAIHGNLGIGKTTLARLVHDDPRIQSHFDFTAWVFLTDKCDMRAAMKEIYQTITGQKCYLGDLETLQNNLRHYLMTRKDNKFFLVIDNLWADDFDFWKNLEAPLLSGGDGSKVLITTCNWKTCQIMHTRISHIPLRGLQNEDCWQIFKSFALPPGFHYDDRSLDRIGMEIVEMCRGAPMAAKVLGAVLYGRNSEEWYNVLHDMQVLTIDFSTVDLASLRVSYHNLHYCLKQCFAYCSIFPEGYVFERDQVIRCWLAEGLIEPNGRRTMEVVGKQYFDELIWRSLFEKISVDTKGQVEKYKIPSLIHHHGILFSDYEFCSLKCGKPLSETKRGKPDQVRYASFLQPKYKSAAKLECLEPYQNLRTLKFFHESSDGMVPLNSIPANFFHKFVDLRVLDLSNSDLEQVPDSVCGLIHLRFLGLSNTNIKTLPENICDLFNLQTLELRGCLKLAVLPEGLRTLINLRHLDLHLDWEEITDLTDVALPPGIGELENLQTLSRFNVASAKGQYCNINELNNLNLRGDLCILNLEKVQSARDARNANLEGKMFIEKLMLRWDNSARNDQLLKQQSKEVINFLQPNNRLSCLWIVNYPGNEFPDWIGYASFSSLATIQISNCSSFSFLPLLSKLPWLENLHIDSVPENSMSMPEGFPSLKHLNLLNLGYERLHLEFEIPQLKKIYVTDCNDLQELIIHRHLHDKFERGLCPNLTTITCVPPK